MVVVVVVVVVCLRGWCIQVVWWKLWNRGMPGMEEAHHAAHVMQRQFLHILYRKRVM